MYLSDLIPSHTRAGAALFLQWNSYHVFSIPKRDLARSSVRFFGVGGKRHNCHESFAECALRESVEEIGRVVAQLEDAPQTEFLRADGTIATIQQLEDPIRPRLILEQREHAKTTVLKPPDRFYYLVAFNASLAAKPQPSNEIAAILYLKDAHLTQMQAGDTLTITDLLRRGAEIEWQSGVTVNESTRVLPHGTAQFLVWRQAAIGNTPPDLPSS